MGKTKIEYFKQVVDLLRAGIINSQVDVLVTSQKNVSFYIHDELDELFDELDSEHKYWDKLTNGEISTYLGSILSETSEEILEFYSKRDGESEEKLKEIIEKFNYVKENLVIKEVMDSYIVNSTSKNKIFQQLDWEISKKLFDDTIGEIDEIKYATLFIQFNEPQSELPIPLKMFENKNNMLSIPFNANKHDINYLIRMLNEIKQALEE